MEFEKLTLDKIEAYLGYAEKQIGGEYIWQCPYCQDKHRDNLKFNPKKGVLYCFASNGEHSQRILKEIYAKDKNSKTVSFNNINSAKYNNKCIIKPKSDNQIDIFTQEKQEELLLYMAKCNEDLLRHDKALKYIEKHRGFNKNTVENCGIGIDLKTHKWVMPTFKYSANPAECTITGFEFRDRNLTKKQISRSKGTPTSMAMINCYTSKTEILAIVEGYMDGYALYQYLTEQNQIEFYHIVTPSNGVNSLLKYIQEIEFSKYKKCYLFIDNDEAGNTTAETIIQRYPFCVHYKLECGCKDFNEHYLKCIKKGICKSDKLAN